jgi:hypothetical protein
LGEGVEVGAGLLVEVAVGRGAGLLVGVDAESSTGVAGDVSATTGLGSAAVSDGAAVAATVVVTA